MATAVGENGDEGTVPVSTLNFLRAGAAEGARARDRGATALGDNGEEGKVPV